MSKITIGRTESRGTAIVAEECFFNASAFEHHCMIDDGHVNPPWLSEGQVFYYFDSQDSFMEIRGLRLPLTTRWIMCPKHEHLVIRELWLKNPTDLHYRGELMELGVRVVDAIEQEMSRHSQM